jgi:probable phosphoglycerate mutase
MKELREIDMGRWDGLGMDEVKRLFPGEFEKRGLDSVNYRPPGGESFADLRARVLPAYREIIGGNDGNIAIVSHAGVNRVILCDIMNLPLKNLFEIKQDYACINRIRYFEK